MDQAVKYYFRHYLWRNVTDSLIFTLIMIGIIWYIRWMWSRRQLYYYTWDVKGPLSFPVIGTLHRFASGRTTEDIMRTLIDVFREFPVVAPFWFGTSLMYLISKPEYIEKILMSPHCLNKDKRYEFISQPLGDGLMTLPADKWKKNRKLIAPSFNQRILDSFVEIFQNQAIILRDILEKHVGAADFDIFHLITNCTLDIICETAMGVQVHAQTSKECELAKNADMMMEISALRIFHLLYHPEVIWKLLPIYQKFTTALSSYKSFCGDIIKKRFEVHQKRMRDQKDGLNAAVEEGGSKKIKAFLDLLLDYGTLDEEQLNAEVNIFILAGTDTTATALAATFLCLGMNPDVQEKVYQEILSILGPDRRVETTDLSKFKYMELVIKETLRLFPVAPFFLRSIGEDIDAGDITFVKGSSAFFCTVHLHRDSTYWEDPLKFDPDRFLPENVAKRHPCAYIPFSYGPRNCIGGRYAIMNMKTILSTVMRRYRFTSAYKSVADVDIASNITLRFTQGTKLTVHER